MKTTRDTPHDVTESRDPASGGKNYHVPDVGKLQPSDKQPDVRSEGDPGSKQ